MRLLFILFIAVSCTTAGKRSPASENSGACANDQIVTIEFPNGFSTAALTPDSNLGVPAVKMYPRVGSKAPQGMTCVFSNETNKPYSFAPDQPAKARVGGASGNLYFVEVGDKFQLTCEAEGARFSSADIPMLNDAMKGQFKISGCD